MEIVISKTSRGAYTGVLAELKKNLETEGRHIVLVPDRFTASVEKGLLHSLGTASSINIEVMSFTRLANKLIGRDIKKCLTPEGSVMLLSRVVDDVEDKLEYYGRAAKVDGIAHELYAAVTALRNSGISTEKLLGGATEMPAALRSKTKDLALIYGGYLEALSDKFSDSTTRLQALVKFLADGGPLGIHFYCTDFYEFKAPEFDILRELSRSALSLCVGIPCGFNFPNKRIYPLRTLEKLKALSENKAQIIVCDEELSPSLGAVAKCLFSYESLETRVENNGKVQLRVAASRADEVLAVVVDIIEKVKKGARYRDFEIFASDINDYKSEIKRAFTRYKIPFFIDTKGMLGEQCKVRFLLAALTVVADGFKRDDVFDFVKNPLFAMRLDKLFEKADGADAVFIFENYALKYNVNFGYFKRDFALTDGNDEIETAEFVRAELESVLSGFCALETEDIGLFTAAARAFLDKFAEEWANYTVELSEMSVYYQKCAEQVDKKIGDVFDEIDEVLGGEADVSHFLKVIREMIETLKIALVPTYLDSVFVGDIESRFLGGGDIYIVGASSGCLPAVSGGGSVLTAKDEEILERLGIEISPNEKQKQYTDMLAICEVMKKPHGKLVVSYPETSASGALRPSTVIAELRGMLSENGAPIELERVNFDRLQAKESIERERIVSAVFSTEEGCFHEVMSRAASSRVDLNDLGHYRAAYTFLSPESKLKLDRMDFEPEFVDIPPSAAMQTSVSVSRLERFFTCPYSYFLNYALRLKKRPEGDFDGNENGIILHFVFEKFYKDIRDGKISDEGDIPKLAYGYFDGAVAENCFERLLAKSKTARPLMRLREECVRACIDLYRIYLRSTFKPTLLEATIGSAEINPTFISVDGKDIKLNGKIDRVDVSDGKFIIVDYKTYRSANFTLSDLYYGEKIQLYIYMKAVENGSGLKPVGVFYLPIFAGFTADTVNRYKFKGQTSDNIETMAKIDSLVLENTEQSVVPYKADSKGNLSPEVHLRDKDFENISEYVTALAADGIRNVAEGYIKPAPLADACKTCMFADICAYKERNIRKCKKVSMASFLDGAPNNDMNMDTEAENGR